jgi:hypothetical protein
LQINQKKFGSDSIEVAKTLENLANSYSEFKYFDKSYECYKNCLKAKLKYFGDFHTEVALTYTNMGIALQKMEKYMWACDSFN